MTSTGGDPREDQAVDASGDEAVDASGDDAVDDITGVDGDTPSSADTDGRATLDERSESGFLQSVEFLTGPDPNLGSFLLVVGMVTIAFIALFQLTIPAPISYILTAGVLFVTVLSALFAFLLDSFGYFDDPRPTPATGEKTRPDARPWVPTTRPSKPLPPLLNFDAELRAYADMFDGDLPAVFDPFVEDYVRLKTNTESRASIASDLRADLNPIGTLFAPDSEGDQLYEVISERLFRYIGSEQDLLTVENVTFVDADGEDTDLGGLAGSVGRVALDVVNDGDAVDADVVVEFRDATGAVVASRTCDAGILGPGARRHVEADVFVPEDAVRATTILAGVDAGRRAGNGTRRTVDS